MSTAMTQQHTGDQLSMALCAIRYCIGRSSYIVAYGVSWARSYGAASPWIRDVLIRDLTEAVERCDREPRTSWMPLGDVFAEREWRRVLVELQVMNGGAVVTDALRGETRAARGEE